SEKPARPDRPKFQPPPVTGGWKLPADFGRRYAAVSGDRNPIHLSNITAKALGMPGAIAPGMYAAGRMLAGRGLPAPFTWAIEFASHVPLHSTVAVLYHQNGDESLLAVGQ